MFKRQKFDTGDLVEIMMIGSPYYQKKGFVIEAITYGLPRDSGLAHEDEYSCRVWVIDKDGALPTREAMIRAKWLKSISKV